MSHFRFIFPVGQGGFALERIDDYVVVYDCGSDTSDSMVECCIDLVSSYIDHVDLLFISHFDKDHVNGMRYLLSKVRVRTAFVSWIEPELRYVYGLYTNGAYSEMIAILKENNVEMTEVGSQQIDRKSFNQKWEWITKSMLTPGDFDEIRNFFQNNGISLDRLEKEPNYLEEKKEDINNAFKTVFGSKGPNSKGLIVLSQRCYDSPQLYTRLFECWPAAYEYSPLPYVYRSLKKEWKESSCLYVGDADLKNGEKNDIVKDFVRRTMRGKQLFLMQIPHHGSSNNIGANFENDYPAQLYLLNDDNTNRLKKSEKLYQSLTIQDKLIVARVRFSMFFTETDL